MGYTMVTMRYLVISYCGIVSSQFILYIILLYIANHSRYKIFPVEEMNCNSLENIHGYMVLLCNCTGHYC